MTAWLQKYLGANWKTNIAAIVSFCLSVPQFYSAIENWAHHQPSDWRGAVVSLVIAAGFAVAKDSTTHSTPAQVEVAATKAMAAGDSAALAGKQ